MSRFNTREKTSTKTKNYEGGAAYTMTPEMELYSLVCTCIMNDKFYRTAEDEMDRMRELLKKVPNEYIAQLAVYAREQMYLRTMPLVLAVELAKQKSNNGLVSRVVNRVIQRADEIPEILACYQELNGHSRLNKLSKQVQKGVASAFHKFDEYQFAKYNRKGPVKMKDALFLTHPKPYGDDQKELFRKIANDELKTPDTWETNLSAEDDRSKKEKWEQLISEKKLGYMATLRNLRNFLEAEVSKEHMQQVCDFLTDREAVKRSKQFPFRFYSAYMEIKELGLSGTKKVLNALEDAATKSVDNMEIFEDGKNAIVCDLSGSMSWNPISKYSKICPIHIGCVLGSLLSVGFDDAVTWVFGETAARITFTGRAPLQDAEDAARIDVGGSTNGFLVIQDMIQNKMVFDNIFLFTDCQLYNEQTYHRMFITSTGQKIVEFKDVWHKYKKDIAPDARLFMFDLEGYGKTPVSVLDRDVTFISGWSDKIFTMLGAVDKGSDAVKEIKKIEI